MSAYNFDIAQIMPKILEGYLKSKGWVEDGVIGNKARIWHRLEDSKFDAEIVQPLDERLRDYQQRMLDVLKVIAEYEQSNINKVAQNIFSYDTDSIKIRVIGNKVTDGRVSIDNGVLRFE